jgi:Fusaric acid resistance protein-like/FUSC-like inner membrane protein yccS
VRRVGGLRWAPLAAWFRASRRALAAGLSHGGWLSFGPFRWADLRVAGALRAGAGMITPLAVGLVTGHLEYGAFAALGAMPAGLVTFQGFSRTRVTAVVLAAFGMAAATFVGSTAADGNGWWLVPAVAVFSYLAGLLVTLGQRLAVAGLQLPIALLIASGIPLRPGDAALRAVLVLAGGLWQAALVAASWAFLPGGRERSSLAVVYRELAAYAAEHGSQPAGAGTAPPSATFGTDVLEDPNPLLRAPDRARLMLLLEEAGRIRVSLAAVASFGPQRSVLEPAAGVLDGLADALGTWRGHHHRAASLEQTLAAIELPEDTAWRWAAAALLGQMRAAVRLLAGLGDNGGEPAVSRADTGQRRTARRADLAAALLTLRANAGVSTEAGRHALRLAVVAAIGEIIAQASGLPHGYWIALTIVIVLRPDYASTIYRGVQRAGGTVIGVGLGAATVLLLHAGTAALVAAAGVTMTIAYAVFAVSYLLYAIFLTDFVVILLALLGQAAGQTAADRLISTGIGAALAIIGYLAWPSWEGESAQAKIARLYETQARYACLVLRAYVRPGRPDPADLRSAQITARRARSDAEASADRLADEPPRPPMTARLAYGLTDTARRIAHASLTLDAAVSAAADGQPPADRATADGQAATRQDIRTMADRFADNIESTAAAIAASLRTLRPPGRLPSLREMQTALYHQLSGSDDDPGTGRRTLGADGLAGPGTVLIDTTDEYTDALDTAADILRRNLASP